MVTEAQQRNNCNKLIGKICRDYYRTLAEPITQIAKALETCGFDSEPMNGSYCGDKGQIHVQVGKKTWLVVQWYLLNPYPATTPKRWEINAYVS
jgi:hypothetical protein